MRFSAAELALARRIVAKEATDLEVEIERRKHLSMSEAYLEFMSEIMNEPLQPSHGATPPWWKQAIMEADQGKLWVEGFGWMDTQLWDDIVKHYGETYGGSNE